MQRRSGQARTAQLSAKTPVARATARPLCRICQRESRACIPLGYSSGPELTAARPLGARRGRVPPPLSAPGRGREVATAAATAPTSTGSSTTAASRPAFESGTAYERSREINPYNWVNYMPTHHSSHTSKLLPNQDRLLTCPRCLYHPLC